MYLKWLFLIDFLETIIRENRLTIEFPCIDLRRDGMKELT